MSRMKDGVSSGKANNSMARSDNSFWISMIRELKTKLQQMGNSVWAQEYMCKYVKYGYIFMNICF